MSDLTLILLAAGDSTRFELPVKKQWLRIGHDPLWLYVTNRLKNSGLFSNIIITAHKDEISFMQMLCDEEIVSGGSTRQESLNNALGKVHSEYVMVTDIARACIDFDLIESLIAHKNRADVIVPSLSITDTVVYHNETIPRENVKCLQTPQLSQTHKLKEALQSKDEFTDESSAIVASGGSRYLIEGKLGAHKITYAHDLLALSCLKKPANATLVGNGFDVHAFEDNKPMVLGGVTIDSPFGFKAHSDGDVAIHALIDALLGASGLGDIGMLFPDSDAQYAGIDSKELLHVTVKKIQDFGFKIANVDITIAAQTPRLSPYKDQMRTRLATIMNLSKGQVNIKATTTEKLGFIGRKEGVGVYATASLYYFDWTQQ
ncbi:MAG: bifunctional 2-C-methyl-D-erythritol 4-phosphate cytidylyltransferase/2-C-methyl-D-erythritol 2,4-cyclodiphosphate synthase [Campylobacterota bacterium]|nr:bifunctional 2-C-methyl-D-erythritol 4-phosphate cytidylyltransferase/2-C-methyl-D-erythritol 2,4-cyclodiphosphate synthase [Campylobacterota bacterium]